MHDIVTYESYLHMKSRIALMFLSFKLLTVLFVIQVNRTLSFLHKTFDRSFGFTHSLYGSNQNKDGFFSLSDIEDYGKVSGLTLNCTTTGPFLRIEAFPIGDPELIGYLTAFIRPLPLGLFHLDTIKVKNRRQNLGYVRKNWTIDGPGISFIMGSYALRWAYERGCRTSQLLAVNDSPMMHAILIRLYGSFGFDIKREVTEDTVSVADRLVWGAIGTLMELDMKSFFSNWTPKLAELVEEAKQKSIDSNGSLAGENNKNK